MLCPQKSSETLLTEIYNAHYTNGMLSRHSVSSISSAMQLFFKSLIYSKYEDLELLKNGRLVPNIFHLLQDYGLIYVYLNVLPRDVQVRDMVLVEFSTKVGEIYGKNAHEIYNLRMRFIDNTSIRLQHVEFFYDLYLKCCEKSIFEPFQRKYFKLILESFDKALKINREIQMERLQKFTTQTKTDTCCSE